jgi:glycerophosphoryl diester phosphodiesterase
MSNGLHPWEATYEEIKSAGLLKNGEYIPTLEDYLDRVLEAGTILLWLDVKSIFALPTDEADELSSRCAEKASEIIREKKADNFVEFIVAKENILKRTLEASNGSWACGLMNPRLSPNYYKDNSYEWANFSTSAIFYRNGETRGEYTIDDYTRNGIRVSVYNVDSEDDRQWYVSQEGKLYTLTTNYPKALLEALDQN